MTDGTSPRVGAARGQTFGADGAGAHPGGAHHGVSGGGRADARLAPLAASLAARLRPVCRDWDAAVFDALVARIAHVQLRWADRGDGA